jgi:hypothetical protein
VTQVFVVVFKTLGSTQVGGITQELVAVFKTLGNTQVGGVTQVFVVVFKICGNEQTGGGVTQVLVVVFKIWGNVQVGGVTQVFVTVFNICGNVQVLGVVSMSSKPIAANGFTLPSFPSGISIILESCKLTNTLSEKIALFNFIFLTFKSRFRKSAVGVALVSPWTAFGTTGAPEEEIKEAGFSGDGLIKKI